MVLAAQHAARVAGVFYFACNIDPSGVKPFEVTPVLNRCLERHRADYASMSATPNGFEQLMTDLGKMHIAIGVSRPHRLLY